jgi:predicted Zn-ribbon and HTH transcriptional regulator
MLVPLELAMLARKNIHLSPELALGWRLGRYAHDWFDGLDQVRIAACGHEDILTALRRLARCPEQGSVTRPAGPRSWDILFLHHLTGTALKMVFLKRLTTLSPALKGLEGKLDDGDPEIVLMYQDGINELISTIVTADPASFCQFSEIRCRVVQLDAAKRPVRCPECLAQDIDRLVEVENHIRCPSCAGLEPEWLAA